jgi:predicted membrane chloride channel (bestrophin family)
MINQDTKREMLRHTVATLAYRGAKAVRGAPDSFAAFKASATTRTPAEILAHIGDLLDWALSIAKGNETWNNAEPLPWNEEIDRFHAALAAFDEYLASDGELSASCERIFQGPIADALTHVGQIAMLRRLAGEPIKGENYSRAKIAAGNVGAEQANPKREFD